MIVCKPICLLGLQSPYLSDHKFKGNLRLISIRHLEELFALIIGFVGCVALMCQIITMCTCCYDGCEAFWSWNWLWVSARGFKPLHFWDISWRVCKSLRARMQIFWSCGLETKRKRKQNKNKSKTWTKSKALLWTQLGALHLDRNTNCCKWELKGGSFWVVGCCGFSLFSKSKARQGHARRRAIDNESSKI